MKSLLIFAFVFCLSLVSICQNTIDDSLSLEKMIIEKYDLIIDESFGSIYKFNDSTDAYLIYDNTFQNHFYIVVENGKWVYLNFDFVIIGYESTDEN